MSKMDQKEISHEDGRLIERAQNCVQWQVLVLAASKLCSAVRQIVN